MAVAAICLMSGVLGSPVSAAPDAAFQTTANPGGGSILTGTLGAASLPAATAALLRRVHAQLGTKPTVVQSAEDALDHSVALLFTSAHNGTPYTGVAIVNANPGAQAAGAALYDVSSRFQSTYRQMMQRLQSLTGTAAPASVKAPVALDPPEPLAVHAFADGTGSISVPADWTVQVAGGGSAQASAPGGAAQVSYNMHFGGLDPANPRAQMFLRTASPMARAGFHGIIAPYTSDAVKAWTTEYETLGRQRGFEPHIHVTSTSPLSATSASFSGTLGAGPKMVRFIAFAFVLPPNPMGMWTVSDSHLFVNDAQVARQAATANAVLDSVRIDFGAVAKQETAIRQMFQQKFEAEIANDRAQDRERLDQTNRALANDRIAQEGMHKSAVAMENYSLDRAVVVNTTNGRHSTVDSNFADTLVQGNPNYQKVPASGLLRGVDY